MASQSCRDVDFGWKDCFMDPLYSNSKNNSRSPDLKHRMEKELPCIHGWHNRLSIQEELRKRGWPSQVRDGEFCMRNVKQISPNKALQGDSKSNLLKFQEHAALVTLLKACAKQKDLHSGSRLHADFLKSGILAENIFVGTALVDMYAKCGALVKAQKVFDELRIRDAVTWNALISGYAQHGHSDEALDCFKNMQDEDLCPDTITFTCILKACGSIGAVEKGEAIHVEVVKQALLDKDIMLGNALVDMYAKCGAIAKAQEVLSKLRVRNVISWNALISGYAHHGHGVEAMNCFEQMQNESLSPDATTFTCIFKACGSIRALEKGKAMHAVIVRQGLLEKHIPLGNALVDMYAKCGALSEAQEVFDELPFRNVVSWNTLIGGYAQLGHGDEALKCFECMQDKGYSPDAVTFTCILKVCGSARAAEKGKEVHAQVVRQGLLGEHVMLGNALVDMYGKCGSLAKAQEMLDELPARDIVSWSALIAGYAQHGHGVEALKCFDRMKDDGLFPNAVTFISILKACGSIGAVESGENVHFEIVRQGILKKNIILRTALVDMYAKCGALAKAQEVFDEFPLRDVVTWNALIAGYTQYGLVAEAMNSFKRMRDEGLSPDAITFVVLLNACSHSGLVDEGQAYFAIMNTDYGIIPSIEHLTCMVDLFGRAGHLDKAVGLIETMPPMDNFLWSALLGACRKWGNVKLGKLAFEHVVQMDKEDAAAYVCLNNIYAALRMQEEATDVDAVGKDDVERICAHGL